jgi:hypothetical protein
MRLFLGRARNIPGLEGEVRKMKSNRLLKGEKGQALIIVVLLMLVSALVIAPMLSHVGTGLKSGKEVFEEKMLGQYAADSGVEDALFKIQTDDPNIPEEWDGPWVNADPYNTPYTYTVSSPVNGNTVEVTIEPHWVLQDLETPPTGMTPHAGMVVVGDVIGEEDGNGLYQIAINVTEDTKTLHVERIGAWLPSGFSYVPGSSSLEDDPSAVYYCEPYEVPHRGGRAIIWDFGEPRPKFEDLPGVDLKRVVTFQFMPPGHPASAFSWVKIQSMDVALCWDVDLKYYQITSTAMNDTYDPPKQITVEAYAAENELRDMGTSVSGDYRAIGASLMIDANHDGYYRDTLLSENDATVSDIPTGTHVEAAYLYWSAWLEGDGDSVYPFPDYCSNFNNWTHGDRWVPDPSPPNVQRRFKGQGGSTDGARTLTMFIPDTVSLDLSPYVDYDLVRVTWNQDASSGVDDDEGLYLAFSGDGGSSWSDDGGDAIEVFLGNSPPSAYSCTIPTEYITDSFRMKLFWNAHNIQDCVYIDNINVEAIAEVCDDSVVFEVNGTQYYFDSDGDPVSGSGEITAGVTDQHFLENFTSSGVPNGFSYACKKDVTQLVKFAGITNGNGTYTVGEVDGDTDNEWSYAAWSMIIIYSGPDIDRHQLYLYDGRFIYSGMDCNVDFDGDGSPGGTVSGFLAPEDIMEAEHAAHLTCFVGEGDDVYGGDPPSDIDCILVNGDYLSNTASPSDNVWNSASPGLVEDGIDIDTFEVTYPTIQPGDAEATIGLPTGTDSWNLVYIILSFSSEVTSGGTIGYLIRG